MYSLDVLMQRGYCYVEGNRAVVGYNREVCPICGRYVKCEAILQGETALKIEGGQKYSDFLVDGSGTYDCIISEKAMHAFYECGITGFDSSEKVHVCRYKGKSYETQDVCYYTLKVTGSIELDLKAMSLKKKHKCEHCGGFDWSRQRLGIIDSVLDMSTWDGNDICRIQSFPGHKIVSEKFKNMVERYKLTGINLKPENEIFKVY